MNWKLPFDIPLVVPTMGLPGWFFDTLGIIVFVVHIAFIYTLIGASTASVLYNIFGVFKKSKTNDLLAYKMTNPTTISENMGALWGSLRYSLFRFYTPDFSIRQFSKFLRIFCTSYMGTSSRSCSRMRINLAGIRYITTKGFISLSAWSRY